MSITKSHKRTFEGLSERIKSARESKGLNQRQLADKCGMSFEAINRAERDRNTPHDHTIKLIARVTDTSVDYLKYGKE